MLARPRKPRTAAPRRRTWLVQKLEARCLLAADTALIHSSDSELLDDITGCFAAFSTDRANAELLQSAQRDELNADREPRSIDSEALLNPSVASVRIVDLMDTPSTELSVTRDAVVALSLNSADMDRLLGGSNSLELYVIYDADMFQYASIPRANNLVIAAAAAQLRGEPIDSARNQVIDWHTVTARTEYIPAELAATEAAIAESQRVGSQRVESQRVDPQQVEAVHVVEAGSTESELAFTELAFTALADQSVRIQMDVRTGTNGQVPQVVIQIAELGPLSGNGEREVLAAAWSSGVPDDSLSSLNDQPSSLLPGVAFHDTESPAKDKPAAQSDFETAVRHATANCDTAGPAKPADRAEVLPAPSQPQPQPQPQLESRSETVDRQPRTSRRTLDIGNISAMASSGNPLTQRAEVTSSSLATQATIADVYAPDVPLVAASTRWIQVPKPARLQVAAFLISRAPRIDASAADKAHQSVALTRVAAPDNHSSTALNPSATISTDVSAAALTTGVINEAATGSSTLTDAPLMEDGPARRTLASEGDVTAVQPVDVGRVGSKEELEEATKREAIVHAHIVDRLLSSPVGLVAVLGLTTIATVNDPQSTNVTLPRLPSP